MSNKQHATRIDVSKNAANVKTRSLLSCFCWESSLNIATFHVEVKGFQFKCNPISFFLLTIFLMPIENIQYYSK